MPIPQTDGLRVPVKAGVERGRPLTFFFDGEPVAAFEGETVAAALLAAGRRVLRTTPVTGTPRGIFCGMGVCFDCLVVVNGEPSRRACMIFAEEGMRIETQVEFGAAE
jgi:D-hydroxyproline dehydrogenase subunit gamma